MRLKCLLLLIYSVQIVSFTAQAQVNCDNDSTGLIPLTVLQEGYYLGLYKGGLYPGGSNEMPLDHKNSGLKIAKSIIPLDLHGNVDLENGKIAITVFGASTAGEPFGHFIDMMEADNDVNPCIIAVKGSYGGKALDIMQYPEIYPWYWDTIISKIVRDGSSADQIQVAWFKSGSKADTIIEMPTMATGIADRYEACLQLLREYFPNLKMVYMSGFIYGGYADPTKEFYDVVSEPGGYYNNFATKWVIERQINGDPNLDFKDPGKKAPWIAWGPYVWADGINPNPDGLFWDCEADFTPDGGGYHLTNVGRDKEGAMLLDFFKNEPTASKWFLNGPKWNGCDPFGRYADAWVDEESEIIINGDIDLYPSPNDGKFFVQFDMPETNNSKLIVNNCLGQLVYEKQLDSFIGEQGIDVDITGQSSGVYYLNVVTSDKIFSQKFMLNK